MLPWIFAILFGLMLVFAWWFVFRSAMKHRNDDSASSQDDIIGGA
jgi:cbb3-type cytochrome oxidase subunit 3